MGRLRPELKAELRSLSTGNYVVFYLAMEDGIDLVRVLHGSRDIGAHDFADDDRA
jgi:toxin ParE1/3/4